MGKKRVVGKSSLRKELLLVLVIVFSTFQASLLILPQHVSGSILHVGGSGPGNFTTIQDAINAAVPGDTILVHRGTYLEQIEIDKTLTLVGEDRDYTHIDNEGSEDIVNVTVDWVNVTGFTVGLRELSWNGSGIKLYRVENCYIANNNVLNKRYRYGIYLDESNNNTVTGNSIWNNSRGILSWRSNDNNISNNVLVNNSAGISSYRSESNSITNNTASSSSRGIDLSWSENITLASNNLSHNVFGTILQWSDNVTVVHNYFSFNEKDGIRIYGSDRVLLAHNTFLLNKDTAVYVRADNSTIVNNTFSYNGEGLSLDDSINARIADNSFTGDGILMEGRLLEHWNTHAIEITNFVNGKPVYYWKNATGGTVPSEAGQVILANCTGVSVENLDIGNVSIGIRLGFSSNNIISQNNVFLNDRYGVYLRFSDGNSIVSNTVLSNNHEGIYLLSSNNNTISGNLVMGNSEGISLRSSNNNTITDNNVSKNGQEGIDVSNSDSTTVTNNSIHSNNLRGVSIGGSDHNTVANNTVLNNEYGIRLSSSLENTLSSNNVSSSGDYGIYIQFSDRNVVINNSISETLNCGLGFRYSDNNTIVNNTISYNELGIEFEHSNDNRIYHNNILNNTRQVHDDSETNIWNDTYPSGGNYWSDYHGTDQLSGLHLDQWGSDGKGDTPYDIPGGLNKDWFPLMRPIEYLPLKNQKPFCNITSPISETSISGIYTITGSACDFDGSIDRVEIRIDDGEWIIAKGNIFWNHDWNTTTVPDGEHTVYVRCFDGFDYSSEVNVTIVVDNVVEPKEDGVWMYIVVLSIVILASSFVVLGIRRMRKKPERE